MLWGAVFLMIAVVAGVVAYGGMLTHPWDGTVIVCVIFLVLAVLTFVKEAMQKRSLR